MASSPLEKNIEAAVCAHAKATGWLVYKFVSPNQRGVPDRIFFKNGKTVLIEFKRPGGKPTALQLVQMRRLKDAGIPVELCDTVEYGKTILEKYDVVTHAVTPIPAESCLVSE